MFAVDEPCQDRDFIPVEHFVLVGGRTTLEDAKGLSNAHHRVASKDLCDDSCCCLRAVWMDSTPRTGKMEKNPTQPCWLGDKTGNPAGRRGNVDQVCNPGTELHVVGNTETAILS